MTGRTRLVLRVRGVVQGVGFRPFVFRRAAERRLGGSVSNGADGVRIEVEGAPEEVAGFLEDLERRPPPLASIEAIEVAEAPASGDVSFRILESDPEGPSRPSIPADLATCPACLAEVTTPGERRYRYPFTSCTDCGPRYSIVRGLPYDRPLTSMAGFAMCQRCRAEYEDPADRRFHAEPIACPECGPRLELLSRAGEVLAREEEALEGALAALRAGRIVAVKGLGGFQLLVDATSGQAVGRLRARKRRAAKPFAVLFSDLDAVRAECIVSEEEARFLASTEAPIVLVLRRPDLVERRIADEVAPGNPRLGAMLPTTPLHHLLAQGSGGPLVCTSGNLSEEPMATEAAEALERLDRLADLFLSHDRPIVRPLDDSVVRVDDAGPAVLRRARGYAPRPIPLARDLPVVLALGAQLKNAIAVGHGREVVLGPHVGDLESPLAIDLLERTASDLLDFLGVAPEAIACDLHPDYASTRLAEVLARERGLPLFRVQHHHAHVASAMAEHGLAGPVLGFAWDGTGYGPDGTVWGGESLVSPGPRFRRAAHFLPFRLPGGEAAIREPRRAAAGVLHALGRAPEGFPASAGKLVAAFLDRGIGSPWSTSAGRLFDAVSFLVGLRAVNEFEGQAAMDLEFAAEGVGPPGDPPPELPLSDEEPFVLDWRPLVESILEDRDRGAEAGALSARFHEGLARGALAIARKIGLARVVLTGGCFQNRRLASRTRVLLEASGFRVHTPAQVPPGDGGIALGQVLVASLLMEE